MTPVTTQSAIQPLISQFELAQWALETNLEGLTNEDSLRPPQPGGNTLNFVLGHVMGARDGILKALGRRPVWDDETANRYLQDGEALVASGKAVPLGRLLSDLERAHHEVVAALKDVSADVLAAKAPFSPSGNPQETIGSLLASFAFHEAYHVGQLGLLRRLCGKAGAIKAPAELAGT